jgi:hypothetical protein
MPLFRVIGFIARPYTELPMFESNISWQGLNSSQLRLDLRNATGSLDWISGEAVIRKVDNAE